MSDQKPRHGVPQPGDVFREYHLAGGGSNGKPGEAWMDEFVFVSHHTGERSTPGDRIMPNVDLTHAVGAEFVVSHWGGHIGSANRRVVFNDRPAVALPLIHDTPTRPECYFSQQCRAACEIPLEYLQQGDNRFRLEVDDQICYSFNWGWFWTNQVILRVYYDAHEVDHPVGRIDAPRSGASVSNQERISCGIDRGEVERIEFVGKYIDFSWEGTGELDTWHGVHWMKDPALDRHVGTAGRLAPYVNWANRWIPDQGDITIAARLVDRSGMISVTEAVDGISLTHAGRTVRMYPASDVPEAFAAQTGSARCTIRVPDPLDRAFVAKLVVSTFSGGRADREVHLNGTAIAKGGWGRWHRLAFCDEPVPVGLLREGDNEFEIHANQPGEHAFEVNWPGPALFVEYLDE